MKKNLDWYKHYTHSHEHPKFRALRVKYGWAGEGRFWALNNIIAHSSECEIDTNEEFRLDGIADVLNFSLEEVTEFLKFLSEKCKLIIFEDGIYSVHGYRFGSISSRKDGAFRCRLRTKRILL